MWDDLWEDMLKPMISFVLAVIGAGGLLGLAWRAFCWTAGIGR